MARPITRPCGTVAAVRRHEYHHEPCCDLCRPVQQQLNRDRRARRRARQAAATTAHETTLQPA